MFTSILLSPPNHRPPNTNNAATTRITKITRTATIPVLAALLLSAISLFLLFIDAASIHATWPPHVKPRLFRPLAKLKLLQSHNSNQLPKRNTQTPARSLQAVPVASSECRLQTRPHHPVSDPLDSAASKLVQEQRSSLEFRARRGSGLAIS